MQRCLPVLFLLLTTIVKAQNIDVLHYRFSIELTDRSDTVNGFAQIKFLQRTNTTNVVFDLTNANREGRGMKIVSASLDSTGTTLLSVQQSAQNFTVTFPSVKKGDTATVYIRYKGIPDDGLIISKNKFGDRTFFSDHWPDRAHHWLPCNDRPDDKATVEFLISAPAQYRVISNGEKVKEKDLGNGLWLTHWKEDVALSTKVMSVGVARFASKTFDDSPETLPISAWVYPQDSAKGTSDFSPAPEMVKFFSSYIASFPYNKLANVESTTIFGGMENASCIFYDENAVNGRGTIEDVVAHEIAHQWFGDAASEKSFAHLWLSEGFATYFTNLWWEQKYGKEAMAERLKKDREEIIAFAKRSMHPVVDSTENLMSLLNANSYQKGGWVLHMLRTEVGDTVFRKIIQAYYNQYKGGNATTRDFETVAEKVSGKELKWFFDQWLYRSSIPNLVVWWKPAKKEIRVVQTQRNTFQLLLEVSFITQTKKKVIIPLNVNQKDQTFQVPGNPAEDPLTLDPNTKLLYTGSALTEEMPKFRKK